MGNYRVERVLGAGSFATVWLATDELLDAKVAIKVLADNWARQPDIRRRFIDEAKILRRLDDDRVVRVHQVDEMADGRPFFVMTWADRATLFDRIQERARQQRAFTIDEAIGLTIEIARCLEVVHDFGIVHRDIKPSNVLFRSAAAPRRAGRRGEQAAVEDRMMLGDFGLAKDLAGASGFTFAAGTPAYMAPEQARSSTDIDERADVFSVTAVLYELLTGRPAFSAETLSGVARSHQGHGPTPLATSRPDAPAALWAVIRHGLAPSPADRIDSAAALIDALDEVRAGRPPAGPPPGTVLAPAPAPPQAPASPPPPPAPPLPAMVSQALQLLDELAQQLGASAPAAVEPVSAARRRLLGPVQVVVVGPSDGTTSELAFALAGERLAPTSRGGHGRVAARIQAAVVQPDRRNTVVEVLRDGGQRTGEVAVDANGAIELLLSGPPGEVAALNVSLLNPLLARRTVIDAGPLLDPAQAPLPGTSRALSEADLLAVILPPDITSGRELLNGLKERLRTSPGGPVLAMGVVSRGPGSTLGAPGSLPTGMAQVVDAYHADAMVGSMLSVVTALADGAAPMVDRAFEALLRHGDAVRITAALALAEEGLATRSEAAARAAYHRLRDAKEAMAATFPSLEELAVLREEASGRLTLPLSFRLELRRLLAGGDPAARLGLSPGASGAELRRTAEQALERWRTFVNTGRAPFASIHASHTVVRALERLWTGSQS
ncbi:MAG: serine/threonine-protein kinase [Acidimicrobiales bacterium]